MHVKLHRKVLVATLAAVLVGLAIPATAAGVNTDIDQGLAATNQPVTVSLVLRLRHEAELEGYARQTATPGSANFQKFLTTTEFAERYGATDAQIAQVQGFLAKNGLHGQVLNNHMVVSVNGTVGQFSKLFNTPVHNYVSPEDGRRFHRPARPLVMPADLSNSVLVASGLSNERQYIPHHTPKLRISNLQV
ncbi:MAG: protease pro-enzyme activation domain-containing protein, partial [Rhodanobacter sp.]